MGIYEKAGIIINTAVLDECFSPRFLSLVPSQNPEG